MKGCIIQDVTPLDTKRMTIDFGTHHYGVTIVGNGKPLVCFHGFSESSYTWENIHIPGYRMIRIDNLGHGSSAKSEEQHLYVMTSIIDDLHRVIQSVAGDQYALMGYSMGARFALVYALTYGKEISHLILESGSVGIRDEGIRQERRQSDEDLAANIETHDSQWFAKTWQQVSIFASQQTLPKEVQRKIFARRAHNMPHALAATLRGSGQGVMPYVGDQLHQLTMPILYISGSLDEKYTHIGKTYFSDYHQMIEGAGHNTHLEDPCAFMAMVEDFLR